MNFIRKKNIGLLGIGRSTLNAYEFLSEKGFDLYIWDDNPEVRNKYKESNLNIINFENWDFTNLDCIICSPGIPLYYPINHRIVKYLNRFDINVITDIELFFHFFPDYKYIGITGSNGKSSLTTLLYEIFKLSGKDVHLAGNIGIPIFSLKNLTKDAYIILELSSFQLSYVKGMKLNIACILNIEDNHNEYHGGFKNYQNAKCNIFKNQTEEDFSIIDINEDYYTQFNALKTQNSKLYKGNNLLISTKYNHIADYFCNNNILYDNLQKAKFGEKKPCTKVIDFTSYMSTKGADYKQMLIFAYVISALAGIKPKIFLEGLNNFKGLSHRQEVIIEFNNIKVINDSKATTPDAVAMALSRFNNIYWLIGGIRKSGNLDKCLLHSYKIKHAFIFGKDKLSFSKELQGKIKFSCYNSLKEATEDAVLKVQQDKSQIKNEQSVILLSPVGTSLDEFNNFEERGNYFKQLIKELLNVTI